MYVPDQRLNPPECDELKIVCSICCNKSEIFYKIDGFILCEDCAKKQYIKDNFTVSKKRGECDGCGETRKLYACEGENMCANCIWENDKYFVQELDFEEYAESLDFESWADDFDRAIDSMKEEWD